jgi:FkbM family methyltransferase
MISHLISTLRTFNFIIKHPLNQNNPIKAVLKFILWQVSARLLKMSVVIPWVNDSKFIAKIGETGLTGNLYAGFMEYEDMLFLLHALSAEDTFIDVGANVGAYTILASKVVGANSIAFEPLPETINRLKDQISINQIHTLVSIKNKGVGEKLSTLFFTNNCDTINKVSTSGKIDNTTEIEVTTLDHELKNKVNLFIKIDVEGYEFNVLQGAIKTLSSGHVVALIIELNGSCEEFGHNMDEIHRKVIDFNFTPISYDPIKRNIKILKSYNSNGGNTIYVKDVDMIAARCKSAPARKIHTAFEIFL